MEVISRKEAKAQGLKFYFTGKTCKFGHVTERYAGNGVCVECHSGQQAEYRQNNKKLLAGYNAEYQKNNKKRLSVYSAEYRANNKDRISERDAKYRANNKERISEYNAEWYQNNKERKSEYERERYANDPYFKAAKSIRDNLRRVLEATNGKKSGQTFEIAGYSPAELKEHIEKQFTDGMTWNNHGEWHIDHIKPVAAFIEEGETNPSVINALSNLQPLWASENLSKGCKY